MRQTLIDIPLFPASSVVSRRGPSPTIYVLALIAALALTVLGQWFYYQPKLNTDAQVWINIGKNLWSDRPLQYSVFYYERIYFTMFLSLIGTIFSFTAEGFLPTILLLSAVNTALVAEVTRQAAGRAAALVSAFLFAGHPIVLTYGSFLVSDTLSLPVSLLTLLCLTRFLKSRRLGFIAVAALLGGMCFFIKSYTALFGLAAILVYALAILLQKVGTWTRAFVLVGLFVLPVFAGHLIHAHLYGDPFFYKNYYDDYARRVYGQTGITWQSLASSATAKLLFERFDYAVQAFEKSGVFASVWGLLTAAFLLRRWRLSLFHATIAATFFALCLFLAFAPVRMSPLVFVEIQTRYLTLPLALLSVGAGLMYNAATASPRLSLKPEATVAIAAFAMAGWFVPNATADDYFHRYRIPDYFALRTAAHDIEGRQEILLPARYRDMFLEELTHRGTRFRFIEMSDAAARSESLREQLACACVVFIPRVQYPVLADRVRVQPLDETSEYGDFDAFARRLTADGFQRVPLTVPYSPLRLLADRLGARAKGELVGWLFRPPGSP